MLIKAEIRVDKGVVLMAPVIGKVIKRYRFLKEISQPELGRRSGVSPSYITKIEQGMYDPSIKTLAKIARVLEVPLWQLIREAEKLAEKEGK